MSGTISLRRLDPGQYHFWKGQGFLVLRDFFSSEELSALSEEAWRLVMREDLIDKRNLRCRFRSNHDDSACLWETFDPVIDLSPACERIARAPQLLDILYDLYGEPACLFKDKLIFKQPGTRGYELHQDWISWPGFPRSFLTVLVPIDAARARNGCTEVFPGYHLGGSLSPEDGEYHPLSRDTVDEATGVKLELEPGDIAFFDGFTPHCSEPNFSDSWRRQLYLSYNALTDGGNQRAKHYRQFHDYLNRKYADHGLSDTYFR